MSFLDLAEKRASVRGYLQEPVSEEHLAAVLEAGRLAPSAANQQPWHVIVVREETVKQQLREAYAKEWFWKAPVILVICTEPARAWTRQDGRNYAAVDAAIALDHMTLCAADLGLGTCWVGAFNPTKVREILGLPEGIEPLAMTPLGTPDPARPVQPKKRKMLEELVRYDRW